MASPSDPSNQQTAARKQNKGPPLKFMFPLIYAPVLPLIRIQLRHNPVLRDRLFTAVLAGAFAHGFYLMDHGVAEEHFAELRDCWAMLVVGWLSKSALAQLSIALDHDLGFPIFASVGVCLYVIGKFMLKCCPKWDRAVGPVVDVAVPWNSEKVRDQISMISRANEPADGGSRKPWLTAILKHLPVCRYHMRLDTPATT
ncbi:hypothetical protein TEA_023484 [Camellia sinensis var. sinensis]|uniref:Uncharacterized protein n=1 Tax=Camellia sinensis var. sinensis TaxID=542762 RepID=A0A4S4DVR9_CAMSN|nr:hypothetical protein TEA_023484 [Camellia sinensis var. sinensis]